MHTFLKAKYVNFILADIITYLLKLFHYAITAPLKNNSNHVDILIYNSLLAFKHTCPKSLQKNIHKYQLLYSVNYRYTSLFKIFYHTVFQTALYINTIQPRRATKVAPARISYIEFSRNLPM